MATSDFSSAEFLNVDLSPKFGRCPNGSCYICCGLCFEVEKLLDIGFETKVENMECTDEVDYVWDDFVARDIMRKPLDKIVDAFD